MIKLPKKPLQSANNWGEGGELPSLPRLTPQQHWQRFRARLPALSRWQRWSLGLAIGLGLALFIVIILPFMLPLGGFDPQPLSQLQDPNGHFIQINGLEVYYLYEAGPPDAATVLLIHGFGGSSGDWQALLELAEGYHVYAVDLVGMGLSQKGLDLDMRQQSQADTLAAFLQAQGIRQVHLVGHDMGANIAVHLAQRHPQYVQSLTLISASMLYEPTAPLPNWVFQTPFLQRWAQILTRAIMPETTEINLRSAAEKEAFITPALIAQQQRVYFTPDWDLALLALARDASQSYLAQPLQTLTPPTLIVWGDLDTWIAPATAAQLDADIPQSEVVMLSGVGHLPMLEAPLALWAALDRFWPTPEGPR